jgi:hypothetical protein
MRLWKQEGAAAEQTTVLSKEHGLFKCWATTEIGKKLGKKWVVGHLCKFNTQQSVKQVALDKLSQISMADVSLQPYSYPHT